MELYEKELEAVVGGRSRKAGRRLHVSWRSLVQGGFLAKTVLRPSVAAFFLRKTFIFRVHR